VGVGTQQTMDVEHDSYYTEYTTESQQPAGAFRTAEEPILTLQVPVGERVQALEVYPNDEVNKVVQEFGNTFHLSQSRRYDLQQQIIQNLALSPNRRNKAREPYDI